MFLISSITDGLSELYRGYGLPGVVYNIALIDSYYICPCTIEISNCITDILSYIQNDRFIIMRGNFKINTFTKYLSDADKGGHFEL